MQGHYTCYEAVEIFGVSLRTVYNWIRKGTLRAVKIGKSWYIPKAAVSELLANGDNPKSHNNE